MVTSIATSLFITSHLGLVPVDVHAKLWTDSTIRKVYFRETTGFQLFNRDVIQVHMIAHFVLGGVCCALEFMLSAAATILEQAVRHKRGGIFPIRQIHLEMHLHFWASSSA